MGVDVNSIEAFTYKSNNDIGDLRIYNSKFEYGPKYLCSKFVNSKIMKESNCIVSFNPIHKLTTYKF